MHPLPEGWSELEVVEDAILVGDLRLHRAGVASKAPSGEEIVGSAADLDASPRDRAGFELLERACTLEALAKRAGTYQAWTEDRRAAGALDVGDVFPESPDPARWRFARSNGIALHASWTAAAERAIAELVERDRVLRSWYGESRPEPVPLDDAPGGDSGLYAFRAYRFAAPPGDPRPLLTAAGVFGFPRDDGGSALPFVCGYAARMSCEAAVRAATQEALQLLAFLWGEPVADDAPLGPTPMHHLDAVTGRAGRERVRAWLDGGHVAFGVARPAMEPPRLVDLTPSWLGGGLRVAKAVAAGAAPLTFGEAPISAHLPRQLRGHPIP